MNDIKKLFLYPSFKCNRKCRFCFISDITKSIYRDSIPLKDLFDSICSGYEKGIRSISFLGGEPTLYEHLQDLISFAKKMNYNRVTIYSNGLIMSDREYVRMLSKFRPINIVMNIPSCREKDFDFITQTAGGLEKTVRALCNLKEFEIKVKAVCVVNKINFQYLAEYSKFYHSYGIDSFQINYLKYAGNLDSRLISNQKNIASMAVAMTEAMTGIGPMLDECDKMSL